METIPTEIYYGSRGSDFKSLINSLLIKGQIKQKYIDLLLNEKNMKIYGDLFTSNLVDPIDNYQYYETIGDGVAKNFIVNYSFRRYPFLKNAEGVQIVSGIVIEYGSKKTFHRFAESLGFWPFITSTQEDKNRNKKDLLEDVFEAFLGGTSSILDEQIRNGVGYAICYDILKNIFDNIEIDLRYEVLFPPKTRLKELFDAFKDLGQAKYEESFVKNDLGHRITTSIVYKVDQKTGKKEELGRGTAAIKDDAQPKAAEQGYLYLSKLGYQKQKSPIYKYIDELYKENNNVFKKVLKNKFT